MSPQMRTACAFLAMSFAGAVCPAGAAPIFL